MSAHATTKLTPEQYLEIERKAEFRSEYHDGAMFAMSGTTLAHSRICMNLSRHLGNQLSGTGCELFDSNVRLKVAPSGLYTYPDLMIVCGEPVLADDAGSFMDMIVNPAVIIEVLSPSTESYDRGKKFKHYKTLKSLREYWLIAQDEAYAERFIREPDDSWRVISVSSLDASLQTPWSFTLPLAALYERVKLFSVGN